MVERVAPEEQVLPTLFSSLQDLGSNVLALEVGLD